METKKHFGKHFKIVTIVHIALIVTVLSVSGLKGCFRKKPDIVLPVQFTVEATAESVSQDIPHMPDAGFKIPDKTPVKKKPPRKKKPIKVSDKRVTRLNNKKPPRKVLTKAEVEKRLAAGAEIGDRTTAVPDEDARCDIIVRRTFYRAWMAPSVQEVGDIVAKVTIRMGREGVVVARQMTNKSGNATMDDSVMQAVNAVKKIPGLTPGYLSRRGSVTIAFRPK